MNIEQEVKVRDSIKYCIENFDSETATNRIVEFWKDELKLKEQELNIPLVMPCTSFEHTAVDLKDGTTAVWTDGLSLNSDNDRHCRYKLEGGQKYKVVVYKA